MKLSFCKIFIILVMLQIIAAVPRMKRAISTYDTMAWTNATIPYFFEDSFSDFEKLNIYAAFSTYQSETCLKFVKYRPDIHSNWLKIVNGENNCFSEIGMRNTGEQSLVLSKTCRNHGLILHELGHTIGLMHEMMRPDRNQFIRYFEENIQEEAKIGFEIDSNHYRLLKTPFDFQSIMMYSPYEFSKNGLPVWMKMNKTDQNPIFDTSEKDLSFWDVKAINSLYDCGKTCSNISCPIVGFIDKNCVCQNPEEFAKRRCRDDPNYEHFCKNASQTNICYSNPIIASARCRKTCGRCFRYGLYGHNLPPPYKCVDKNETVCLNNKNDGYCFFDTWTKYYCPKSCDRCTNYSVSNTIEFECKDRHNSDLCEDWAKNDQCNINPGFMKSNCALSCGTCSNSSVIKKPSAPCRNYSPDSYCDAMARENKCKGTTLKVCLGSCGNCGLNYERNEANKTENEIAKIHDKKIKKECKDLLTNCEHYANVGQCQTQKDSMAYYCAKTCNVCSKGLCKNEDSDHVCDVVKQRGMCSLHAGFANRCQKTCNMCQIIESNSTEECTDRDSTYICSEIVRRKQCDSDGNQRCRFSCNLCNLTSNFDISTPTLQNTTTIPCIDEDSEEFCLSLRERSLCQSYLDRAVLCRKSCNLCILHIDTTPVDMCKNMEADETCTSWASSGYCNQNPEYMKDNCAKACNYCENSKEILDTNMKCADISNQCESWKEHGYCAAYAEYMKTNCPYSCGFCSQTNLTSSSIRTTSTTVSVICKNIESDESCDSWKDNYCSIDHIANLCKKTCGKCT